MDEIKIWYDSEGDYLEVIFERKAGYFRETGNEAALRERHLPKSLNMHHL